MKNKFILLALIALPSLSMAQLINESFEEGIPVDWTQESDIDVPWEALPSFGVEGTDCAVADFTPSSEMGSSWLRTPLLDLTILTDPELIFSTAVVRNIFVAPRISLWYDIGDGWVYLTNWGSEWDGEADNTIEVSNNLVAVLDPENLIWNVDLTYDLADLASFSSVRFAFESDFQNGGWALLDDIKVQSEGFESAGILESNDLKSLSVYPNPSKGLLYIDNKSDEIDRVMVYDLLGQKVHDQLLQGTTQQLSILDLTEGDKGTYCLVFYGSNQECYKRLVIIE